MARPMIVETVSNIEIVNGGALLLRLASGGRPSYQYIYRASAGVYWDQEKYAFKLAARANDDYAKCFAHMLKILEDEMGLQIVFRMKLRGSTYLTRSKMKFRASPFSASLDTPITLRCSAWGLLNKMCIFLF
jgi:hypothetical protein